MICAGGGGVPTMYSNRARERTLIGVEAVIDKDLASELLAREVEADLFVMATDVDGVYADWGTPEQRRLERVTADELRAGSSSPPGSMGPKVEAAVRFVERDRQAGGDRRPRRTSRRSWRATAGPRWWRRDRARARRTEETMTEFGVHSEVGKLRKVMVHRPELSLQRLTPSNHDELLFDDVLWVERAQYEHDQFVAGDARSGVEVFLFRDLLGEALAASEEGRRRLIELAASEYTVGVSAGR